MTAERLRIERLSAGYGRERIIRDITFSLPERQFCALVGQNGSGKSTLLRAVCGLLPYSGHCLIGNAEVSQMSVKERAAGIGYLSQDSETVKGISCLEMALLGFYARFGAFKMPGEPQKRKAMEQLEELGAAELANKDFASVSTGQRQLVRVARTLVTEPGLLILDEADAALDLQHRKDVFSALKKRTQSGGSVLLVSHDINAVLGIADRIIMLRNGELTDDGPCTPENAESIQTAMQKLYGSVEVFCRGGRLMMGELP